MGTVELDDSEWSQVIAIIANSHPLIMKISTQLVAQKQQAAKGNSHAEEQHPQAPR